MAQQTGDNKFGVAKWIVDAVAGQGTHTTIASALTSASSGDTIFIRPGTYTENFTHKAGVNLVAFRGDSTAPEVTIIGTITHNTAGTCTIANCRLQTNAATNIIVVSGANISVLYLQGCYLNCTTNTGISFTNSNASSAISLDNCMGDITANGIAFFASSSAGSLSFRSCYIVNSGNSTTQNTISAGTLSLNYTFFSTPITTSGTSRLFLRHSIVETNAINTTCLTCGGSNGQEINTSRLVSGTASAISCGDVVSLANSSVNSSNANAITGAGTLVYTDVAFIGSSSTINTTTLTNRTYRTANLYSSGQVDLLTGTNPINVGTDAVAKTITIGNTTGASKLDLKTGTGDFSLASATGNIVVAQDSGEVTEPLQPAFSAYLTNTTANVTGAGTAYNINAVAFTEIFDQNADFAAASGIFTAPVTGIYDLRALVSISDLTAAMTRGDLFITTTAQSYQSQSYSWGVARNSSNLVKVSFDVLANMTAGDTAYMAIRIYNGAGDTADLDGTSTLTTMFMGKLVC